MLKTCVLLLALACVAALGIECVKGNVILVNGKTRLPATILRVEGKNCPLYYTNDGH